MTPASPRKLWCARCGKYMGEVRDGSLRVGLVVICSPCNEKESARGFSKESENPFTDIFGDLFRR